ncbi:MAG: hypothetical protein HKN21_05160 [Candidatus Eisenbacteria bacterium]|uniref:Glycosyltransferase RgtA/B/C/D-like domain-containing protein n=1 Tax=Eiseniibacteriota bacterium TaxID=2212470 RepID=A0A7Y2EA61_UNCEI|nr:hypothetical protein [Candidatus Eisenbacteria bacterium]
MGSQRPGVSPGFYTIFCLLLIGHATVILLTRFHPYTDLPFHLAEATITRFYNNPAMAFSEYFHVDLFPRPNVMFLWLSTWVTVVEVETLFRVLEVIYVLALPILFFFMVRRLSGDPWFSLLGFLALYNFNVSWGFINFFLGIPAILLFSLLLNRWLRRGGAWVGLSLAILMALLFVQHMLLFLFSGLILLVGWLLQPKRTPVQTLPLIPALVLGVGWIATDAAIGAGDTPAFLIDYLKDYPASIINRIKVYRIEHAQLSGGTWTKPLVGLAFSLPVIALAFVAWRRRASRIARLIRIHPGIAAFAFSAAGCYWILPGHFPDQWFLYQRFLVFLLLGLVLIASTLKIPRLGRALVTLLAVGHLAVYSEYFVSFDREAKPILDVMPQPGEGKLAGFMYDNGFRGSNPFVHFPAYHMVWNKDIAVSALCDFRFSLIDRKADEQKLPVYKDWLDRDWVYDMRYRDIPLLLVKGELPGQTKSRLTDYETRGVSGGWTLLGKP